MKVTDFEVFVRRLPAWACAAISIVVILPFDALAEENAGAWERGFTVAPYGWLAGFDGTVGVPSQDIDQAGALGLPLRLDVELNGELEEIGFMFYADWRGERWTVFFDSVWVNVTQAADVSIGQLLPDSVVKATIDGNIYTVAGGYRLKDWQASTLTVYAGPRYYDVEATVDAEGGLLPVPVSATEKRTWTDAVAGLRFGTRLGEDWHLSLSADVGAASSTKSRQAAVYVSYRIKRFSLVGGYRHLAVDYDRDGLLLDVALSGPLVGMSWRF